MCHGQQDIDGHRVVCQPVIQDGYCLFIDMGEKLCETCTTYKLNLSSVQAFLLCFSFCFSFLFFFFSNSKMSCMQNLFNTCNSLILLRWTAVHSLWVGQLVGSKGSRKLAPETKLTNLNFWAKCVNHQLICNLFYTLITAQCAHSVHQCHCSLSTTIRMCETIMIMGCFASDVVVHPFQLSDSLKFKRVHKRSHQ